MIPDIGVAVAEGIAGASQRETPQAYRVLTGHDLLALELPPREYIVSPWLPERGLAMVYGPRGIGKTHLILHIAHAVACGGEFLGWQVPKPRRVLVIDGEMPAIALKERLAMVAQDTRAEPPAPDYLQFLAADLQESGLDLANDAQARRLEPHLVGIDLIIVDNISTLATGFGRENEAESWLPIQQWALAQRRAGRSVLFVHHAGKGGAQRGTSRREDVLDTVIALRRPDDADPAQGARFHLHFEKNRGFHGTEAEPFEAHLTPTGWVTKALADHEMARVVALTQDGASVRDIAEVTGLTRSKVNRIQQHARHDGRLPPAPEQLRRGRQSA